MWGYKTNEDDVARISTSVYIMNFPESMSAKKLFHACSQYGHVVDSFIPTKKSKNGKRFGFVRFINANFARFQRPAAKKDGDGGKKTFTFPVPKEQLKSNVIPRGGNSYMGALKREPSIVLGDECVNDNNLSNALLGRVLLEFKSEESKNKFKDNVSVASWFSQIIEASTNFEVEGRIAWVEVEGVPFKLWSGNTFFRIANKWGKLLDVDDQEETCFHSKRLCIHMKSGADDEDETNSMERECDGQKFGGMDENNDDKEVPDIMFEDEELVSDDSLKYPPGYTPFDGTNEKTESDVVDRVQKCEDLKTGNKEKVNDAYSDCQDYNNSKVNGNESFSSGHFKKSELPRTGGSIIGVLEEVVKVGQVMGYKMEGCISNLGEIIGSQGVDEDYFVISRGHWRLTDQKMMIIAVYAPQESKEKQNLWDYLQQDIGKWKGEVIIMGDFNEVRFKSDRSVIGINLIWCLEKNVKAKCMKELEAVDMIIDNGNVTEEVMINHSKIIQQLQKCDKIDSMEMAQKAKVKWVVEGDENSGFFHGTINKRRNIWNIRGVMVVGTWIDRPENITLDQRNDLERDVTNDEIKKAVWDCGTDKAPRSDGFTFGFFGTFGGLVNLSHMFYADDAVFVGEWSERNITTLVHVLECFHKASGLKINMSKSKIIWFHMESGRVVRAADKLGCLVLKTPFLYLGSLVGGDMHRLQVWNVILDRVRSRLSKWKMKMPLIEGRLSLVKPVLGSMPIFHMSMFKVPSGILRTLELIRCHFLMDTIFQVRKLLGFNGIRFLSQDSSLWSRVIKAIHGRDENIGMGLINGTKSCWMNIVNEIDFLAKKNINLMNYLHITLGSGESTSFWEDIWCAGGKLKDRYPRAFSLENRKSITVASKLLHPNLIHSFHREPRGGVEQFQMEELTVAMHYGDNKTKWIRYVPIKVNTLAWKDMMNSLLTRFNISRRGIEIDSISCVNCQLGVETTNLLFFTCDLAKQISRLIARWWDVPCIEIDSYDSWLRFAPAFCQTQCTAFCLGNSLAFYLGKTLPISKPGCVLCQDVVAFCLEDVLRFVSRSLRFVSRPSCVLSQDLCVLSQDQAAFCLKISTFCVSRPSCVLSQGPYRMGTVRETLAESTEGAPQFAGYGGAQTRVGNVNPSQARLGQARPVKCYNCNEQLLFLAGGQDNAFDDDAPTAQTMFMANLSSADPVTDEAGPSYDSEVPDHDHYQNVACAHHEEHVMHDSVQLDHVVDTHADYTTDSNMIPYDQYVKDNEVPVVHSDVSSVPNDAFMMIYNDMCEYHAQSVSNPSRNTVVKNSLTAELATYKEQVELVAIGYKIPLCLTLAKQVQPALYNGHEIIKDNHAQAIVHNIEDTLEIAEITRKKINAKMNDPECVTRKVKIAPHDYLKENFLATFTPQKQLTPEQIFWSNDLMKLKSKALKEWTKLKYQNLKDSIRNNPPTPDKDTPDFDSVFVIGKMQASLQGKDNVIRQLKKQLSQLQVTRSDTDRTLNVRTTDSQITGLTNQVTNLQAHNDMFRVENDKIKQHYKELYDFIKITRAKHIEQVTKLTTKNVNLKTSVSKDKVNPQVLVRDKHAIDVEPIVPSLRNNRDAHLDYLKHLKESVEIIRDIVEEAKVVRPLDRSIVSACRYTKHSQELLEYAIGTCPQGS
nr:RNA-directed DNA polymerase, eukaryota [Tanacetum cinerariifolium]